MFLLKNLKNIEIQRNKNKNYMINQTEIGQSEDITVIVLNIITTEKAPNMVLTPPK